MFIEIILEQILKTIQNFGSRDAFYIDKKLFDYNSFAQIISNIRKAIVQNNCSDEKNIGIILNDGIETYASIIAIWLEGMAYIPINPETPADRNNRIISQSQINTIIDCSGLFLNSTCNVILVKELPNSEINITPLDVSDDELAYIFFTSGTTGEPKGVPITRLNIASFILAFWELGLKIDETDKVLQMFEFTFDLSVMSYLVPMLKGSCIYTIPKSKIKYNYIFELIDEHDLTVALMVPSILHYLRQYFDEIDAPKMRYSLFCGEALYLDVTKEWSKCLPNAEILNVYGPTENTIFCTSYTYNRNSKNKEHNGILCIGKPMKGVKTIIIGENNNKLPKGQKGEFCLAGALLTPGYWKNPEKNLEAFFDYHENGESTRFYKTGDLCVEDIDGDISYLGRIDFQTKIQGFRVELSEIEFHARAFLNNTNLVALAITNSIGNNEIGLAFESETFDINELLNYLNTKMPLYMIPTKFKFVKNFPLNSNGKTDRKMLILDF